MNTMLKSVKFSTKIKFKLNTLGKKIPLIHTTKKCHQITINIVTHKSINSWVSFLYDLCFIYQIAIKTARIS